MANKSLILVDGSYYLFRAYHGMPEFNNSAGEPTGAIYGVINMLRKLLAEHEPDFFAIIFDAKGKSFRNDIYPEYKANRPPAPEELVCQIAPLHDIIRGLGLPLIVIDGVEADDVIATLASQAKRQGMQTLISSGDKDLAQIVDADIRLLNTRNGVVLDAEGVHKKYGVMPKQIVDYLALTGDSVDNVPGVPRVGPKTAAKWLAEYGTLDKIINHATDIPGKVGENLRDNLAQLYLSKQLVTLKPDLVLPVTPADLVRNEPDIGSLRRHYQRWEFRSWLAGLQTGETEASSPGENETGHVDVPIQYETIFSEQVLDDWISRLQEADLVAVDTETTSLDTMQAQIVGISFSVKPGQAAYVPLAHDYTGAPQQLSREHVLQRLKPLLESPNKAKVGHNLKYDMSVLANHGIGLQGIQHDTMLQSYVLDSVASRHDMDSLALKFLNITTLHYEDVAGKGAKQIPFNQVTVETAAPYAAEDADITLRLHHEFWHRLTTNEALKTLYETIEMPLLEVLSEMERNGVRIDADLLRQQSIELQEQMHFIEQKAHELAGRSFNIGSPKQIQSILYEQLQLPVRAKTPKGQPSTAESVLQELARDHELPGLILEHRGLSKLKSTYTDRLPQQINEHTGRIHASFHQAVAATGRLSSSDPNLQNIPVRTPQGRRIRQAFIAAPGCALLAADYSQIELRIMAHLSADTGLLEAFARHEDVHRATAAEVFGTTQDQVSTEQRRAAKAINFGLIYGMSAFGLAKQLDINRTAAQNYVDRYFARYPGVKGYMDRIKAEAKQTGYVETLFQRRLYLPEINSRNAPRRQYAERTAINAPMQGTAADIIKRAMIAIHEEILHNNDGVRMIMQVHDELVFEVANDMIEEIKAEIKRLMEGAAELAVPLEVEIGTGVSWDQAH
ncbi:MAG: DNA polymerase I [Gammaproteobacteria bacterium]